MHTCVRTLGICDVHGFHVLLIRRGLLTLFIGAALLHANIAISWHLGTFMLAAIGWGDLKNGAWGLSQCIDPRISYLFAFHLAEFAFVASDDT